MPKKSLYIPDGVDRDVIAAAPAESYSGRVAYLCALGHRLALDSAPALTLGEWCAVADALNGYWLDYEAGVEAVASGVRHELFDAAPELDERWQVDCTALSRRLAEMPLGAQAAVLEIGRAYWRRPEVRDGDQDHEAVFRALGAPIVTLEDQALHEGLGMKYWRT